MQLITLCFHRQCSVRVEQHERRLLAPTLQVYCYANEMRLCYRFLRSVRHTRAAARAPDRLTIPVDRLPQHVPVDVPCLHRRSHRTRRSQESLLRRFGDPRRRSRRPQLLQHTQLVHLVNNVPLLSALCLGPNLHATV